MQGIKEIGSYSNPIEVGYTEWIETRAGKYFVKFDTGEVDGPYPSGVKPAVQSSVNQETAPPSGDADADPA